MMHHDHNDENFYLYKPSFLEVFVNSKTCLVLSAFLIAVFIYAFVVCSIVDFKNMAVLLCCFVYMVCVLICYGFLTIIAHMSLSIIGSFRRAFKLNVRYIKGDDSLSMVVSAESYEVTPIDDSEEEIDDIPSRVLNLVESGKKKMEIVKDVWGVSSGKKYQVASRLFDEIVKAKTLV